MPVETGNTISALDQSWPLGGDKTNKGDDHIRLLKTVLKSQFPGASGQGFQTAILATEQQINFLVGVTSSIQEQIDEVNNRFQNMYPVGSIYVNASVDTNPATLLGFGTWSRFGQGRVMVGQSSDALFNAPEQTGGSKDSVVVQHNHSATTASAGSHSHDAIRNPSGSLVSGANFQGGTGFGFVKPTGAAGDHTHGVTVDNAGESGADKNLQPYIVVYSWKRTA